MRIAVMGAGAVGSWVGAKLAKAGNDVWLIARGKHLKAMQERGLQVNSINGDFHLKVNVTNDPKEVGVVELVLFCVKSYDTEQAIKDCKPLVGENTVVMSLQNGVDNEEKIAAVVGKEKVLPAMTRVFVQVSEPGVVEHYRIGKIDFGEIMGEKSERVQKLKKVFDDAGVPATVSDNIMLDLWKKFLWNCMFNQACAVTKKNCGEVMDTENELLHALGKEVITVANAEGFALKEEDITKVIELVSGARDSKPSMLQDIEKGKKTEHEAFAGVVIRLGEKHGIETPMNQTIYEALSAMPQNHA